MKNALSEVALSLKENDYKFITISPDSHSRILSRASHSKHTSLQLVLRDFFGWNMWVDKNALPRPIIEPLERTELIEEQGHLVKSRVRASTYNDLMFFHSGFPTEERDSVFFGPDSYRFLNFLEAQRFEGRVIFDIGCGSGVGGLALHDFLKRQGKGNIQAFLSDVNAKALEFSELNAEINEVQNVKTVQTQFANDAPKECEIFISNPPFIVDEKSRVYRDGGGRYGIEISCGIIKSFLDFNRQVKSLYMYTGTPVVDGVDVFLNTIRPLLNDSQISKWRYREIDPDIFGEQLDRPAYRYFERLSAVGLVIDCR